MLIRFSCALVIVALLPACAPTRQPRGAVQTSGFLHDYSILEAGGEDQAKLRYVDPSADFSRYQAVLVDSVTLWSGPQLAKLKPEEKQVLVDHAYEALVTALGRSFTIAKAPGAARCACAAPSGGDLLARRGGHGRQRDPAGAPDRRAGRPLGQHGRDGGRGFGGVR
jgi:hypothetical protein